MFDGAVNRPRTCRIRCQQLQDRDVQASLYRGTGFRHLDIRGREA